MLGASRPANNNGPILVLVCVVVIAAAGIVGYVGWTRGWFSSQPTSQPPPVDETATPEPSSAAPTASPTATPATPAPPGTPSVVSATVTFGTTTCAKGQCTVNGSYTIESTPRSKTFTFAGKAGAKGPTSETLKFLQADPGVCAYPCKAGAYKFTDETEEVTGTVVEVEGKTVKIAYSLKGTKHTAAVQNPKIRQGAKTVPVSGALLHKTVKARAFLALPSKLAASMALVGADHKKMS